MWVGAWLFRFSTDSEANMSISKRHILIYKDGKWQPESPGSDSEAEAVQEACQQWDKIASAAGYTGAENILDLDYSATQNKALFTPSHLDEKSDRACTFFSFSALQKREMIFITNLSRSE